MVCQRCIDAVRNIFETVTKMQIASIKLGEVEMKDDVSAKKLAEISQKLKDNGFELLTNRQSQLIAKIKTAVLQYIQGAQSFSTNFSQYLSDQLHYDYSHLSKLFSSFEGITIERYLILQKIEKAKELLFYDELTISQIADQLNYSSVAHLSGQFKKETGMTPSQFRQLKQPGHQPLDRI